jgi:acyl-CoA thioester hydrolase
MTPPKTQPLRRQKGNYFAIEPEAPAPLVVRIKHRIRFSDVDPMAVLWHGRYCQLFEQASEELGRACGLGYAEFVRDRLQAPVVQLHVDYFAPVILGEQVSITGKLLWNDGARIDTEYLIHKEKGPLAAAGYTVQMFVDSSGTPLMASPPMLETCRKRWRAGDFAELK